MCLQVKSTERRRDNNEIICTANNITKLNDTSYVSAALAKWNFVEKGQKYQEPAWMIKLMRKVECEKDTSNLEEAKRT